MTLDECDRIAQSAVSKVGGTRAILCLYTGLMPEFCEPMLRDPLPVLGWPFDALEQETATARDINPTIEDGVLMFGRKDVATAYRSTGWSYRLFPPPAVAATVANKGSAFNSCLLMSQVERVDALYQIGERRAWRFRLGLASPL
ncbi:MAG: hypothetical protein AB7Q23_10395 [Hyphomonadaceae bacterium]